MKTWFVTIRGEDDAHGSFNLQTQVDAQNPADALAGALSAWRIDAKALTRVHVQEFKDRPEDNK